MVGEAVLSRPEPRYSRYREYVEGVTMEGTVMDFLFVLGSLLYEVMTGVVPYHDCDSGEISELYKAHKFPSVEQIWSREVGKIVLKCWNEEYESIGKLQDEFDVVEVENMGSLHSIAELQKTFDLREVESKRVGECNVK